MVSLQNHLCRTGRLYGDKILTGEIYFTDNSKDLLLKFVNNYNNYISVPVSSTALNDIIVLINFLYITGYTTILTVDYTNFNYYISIVGTISGERYTVPEFVSKLPSRIYSQFM